jgi:hypothetical protein
MKKIFFMALLSMTMIGWGALAASAQNWTWEVSETTITPNAVEITANPVTAEVYGIDGDGTPGVLSPTYTTEGVTQTAGDASPIVDLVAGADGIVYVISDTAVSTWDPALNSFTALDAQPIIPTDMTGTYKNIAVGMDGALYVLFENTSAEQYLLKGYPPYFTEGVVIGFEPRTLNLNSQGNFVSIDITLPSDLDEADIDPASLMITKIEVAGVGFAEGLAILRANAPCGVDPKTGAYRVKFYRSYKRLSDVTQSITWQLEQIMAEQDKGKYDATLTLEGSVNGYPTKFQGEASFTALVSKAAKEHKGKGNKNK